MVGFKDIMKIIAITVPKNDNTYAGIESFYQFKFKKLNG